MQTLDILSYKIVKKVHNKIYKNHGMKLTKITELKDNKTSKIPNVQESHILGIF